MLAALLESHFFIFFLMAGTGAKAVKELWKLWMLLAVWASGCLYENNTSKQHPDV